MFKIKFCTEKSAKAYDRYGCYIILYGTEIANYIHLGLNAAKNTHCQKYALFQKKKKKKSNESCSKLNFVPKSLRGVKDRFFDFSMIDQSISNFRKS